MSFDTFDYADSTMRAGLFAGASFVDAAGFSTESSSEEGTGTAVLDRPEEDTKSKEKKDDGGDADRFAHYVSKDRIAESRLTGRPVVALCGKIWVPKRNPADYPVCPDCKRIYEQMGR